VKVFVSADIEGVCGATAWDEARKDSPTYREFQRQMNREVAAACEGAIAAGATDIVVKDAHGDGRNLTAGELPRPVRLLRAYDGHPFAMVQGLDASFDAVLMVGYHSGAGSGGNPLAHTLSSRKLHQLRLDGEPASEFRIHLHAAASIGVPVAMVTGDQALCDEVDKLGVGITTVAVKEGRGASTLSRHPDDAVEAVRAGAEAAVGGNLSSGGMTPGCPTQLEVVFQDHAAAFARSHYPGAELVDAHTVAFAHDDYFEILRALLFLVSL
jgi:D-amino peptidase